MNDFRTFFKRISIIFAFIAGLAFMIGAMLSASIGGGILFAGMVILFWLVIVGIFAILYWLFD